MTPARILAALEPHVNETPKSEHDAGNVLTDAAQSRAPFFFDRYINGVRMAEDVCIERETTLEGAMQAATRIAAKGPNGEAPVLVYRAPAAKAESRRIEDATDARAEALKEALQALRGAGSFGRTAAEKHAALEQYCLCRDAILTLIGGAE